MKRHFRSLTLVMVLMVCLLMIHQFPSTRRVLS